MKLDQGGQSLVELSVSLAIVAITIAMAAPQLASAGIRYRERAVISEFASELRTARMLAITRKQRVDVRVGQDGRSLEITTGGESSVLLRRYEFRASGVAVESWPSSRSVWFHPSGRSASPIRVTLIGSEAKRWDITISMTGRIGVL